MRGPKPGTVVECKCGERIVWPEKLEKVTLGREEAMNDAERAALSTTEAFQQIFEKVNSTMAVYGGVEVEVRAPGDPRKKEARADIDDRLIEFIETLFERAKAVKDERGEGWETGFNPPERAKIAELLIRRKSSSVITLGEAKPREGGG